MLFAKIAIQDAFFHGFMYKRLFRFQRAADHMGQPLACKSRIGNKDDASQRGINRILSVMI